MNKRLRKKLHRKYLIDVVYGISCSSVWRKKLFDSDFGLKFLISYEFSDDLSIDLKRIIGKNNLNYYVSKLDGEIPYRDFYYEGGVYFKFEAVSFTSIVDYSFNNKDVY